MYILTQHTDNGWVLMHPNLEYEAISASFAYTILENPEIIRMEELL